MSGRRRLIACCLLAVLTAGCIGTKPLLYTEEQAQTPCQIGATWESRVVYAPDTQHNGVPTPGLAGRLYLFGPETGHPLVGDGSVVVDLYDDTPVATGGQPRLIEKWCIDKDTLKRLVRKDIIGAGYSLFLPWGTYRPEINHVHLVVSYTPGKGAPLFAPGESMVLNKDGEPAQVASRTVVPAAGGVVQAGHYGPANSPVSQAGYNTLPPPPPPPPPQLLGHLPADGDATAPRASGTLDVQRFTWQR